MSRPSGTCPDGGAASPPAPPVPPSRPDGTAALDAQSLFRGRREIVIAHGGQFYRLRITQNGKLILTK